MARQPILDRKGSLFAYELLYRKAGGLSAGSLSTADEHKSVLNAMVEVGLNRLSGDRPAFFNVSPSLLTSVCTSIIPPKRVVLELLENTVYDKPTAARIVDLKRQGYTIAYDDFTFEPHQLAFVGKVDLFKVDVMDTPWPKIVQGIGKLRASGAKLLAEKVEDRAMYAKCRALGFDLFQGYYFSKPETLSAKGVDPRQRAVLRLLGILNRTDVTQREIEEAIVRDAALAARLLKLVNTAGFGVSGRVDSIRVAVQMLGLRRLQAFATLLAASGGSGEGHQALSELGLVRARMCEHVAKALGLDSPDRHFTIGLLSVLGALLSLPMDQIARDMELAPDIAGPLLKPETDLVLRTVLSYEQDGWAELFDTKLNAAQFGAAYNSVVAETTFVA